MRVLNDLPPFGGMLFQTVELVIVFCFFLFLVATHLFNMLLPKCHYLRLNNFKSVSIIIYRDVHRAVMYKRGVKYDFVLKLLIFPTRMRKSQLQRFW